LVELLLSTLVVENVKADKQEQVEYTQTQETRKKILRIFECLP
jgi:hypothetical protein